MVRLLLYGVVLLHLVATAVGESKIHILPREPILPKEPMVIKVEVKSLTTNKLRIEYRGCHKFCVGVISGYPYNEDVKVWNPYNQSTNQAYYFRYVAVDMEGCEWPKWGSTTKIPELFFDTTSTSDTNNVRFSFGDPVNYNQDPKQGVDSYNSYVLSYPARIQGDSFNFLLYHPQIQPSSEWTVRWTGYMNTCIFPKNGTIPIDNHYEPNAFDPEQYVTF